MKRFMLLLILLTLLMPLTVLSQDNTTCEDGFRLFDQELLATDPICVPENPERVISLDALSFDLMLASGQRPVGAVGYLDIVVRSNFPYLADQIDGLANMGFPPTVESVLEAEPDLIIITTLDVEIYDELSAIAPTAMYEYDASGEWQESMIFLGDLLNLTEEVDQLFANYYARLDVLAEALGDPSDVEVSIVRILQDNIMLNLVNSFPSVVIEDAGLSRPASQAYTVEEALDVYSEEIGVFISFEDLQLADGEHIFIWGQMATGTEDDELLGAYTADANMQALQESPLWQTLDGVQNEQVYPVGGYWVGWGFAAANAIIDDLFIYLADVDPREVSPNPFRSEVVESASADTCEAGFRLFDHEYLQGDPVCIPENPQSVVPLDIISFEFMLINDIQPPVTGALALQFFATTQPEWVSRFTEISEGLPDIGFPANPEVALSVSPDLIIGTAGYYDDNIYDEMAQIAPMIVFNAPVDTVGQNWQPNYEFVAQAFGMENEFEQIVADYEARITALDEALGDSLDGQTISVVRAVPPDQLGLRLAGSFSGILLNDLGIAQPESQQAFYDETTGFIQINIGQESWQQVDGDYLFVYGVQPTSEGTTEATALVESLADDPIWNTLSAVQNERVFAVAGHWHGFGVLAAHDIIDDLFTIVNGTEPTIPNPFMVETSE
ncbi:MAG: iron-siderophore ABC transporter substrate-binding protein [Chloroflexota bacterium]